MFHRTYHATHPEMMEGASNAALRDRYLIDALFRRGECVLNYTHADRLVIGGVLVGDAEVRLPDQTQPASAAGQPFLQRRELGIINVGAGSGTVVVDGEAFTLDRLDCLYVAMGCADVRFAGADARFYLVSAPAHQRFATRKLSIADANALSRGSMAEANERTIHQLIIPGVCDSAQLVMGVTVLQPGNVWNTMPAHVHDRRSEIYFYFDLDQPEDSRVIHFMGRGDGMRQIVIANEQAVISPPWSIHMGVATRAYSFVWAMAGENQDYADMDAIDIGQLA
ncbi:5-dehydro-4-deoxy-D-glucuronate isomerase [Sphingomonas aracearum]|uniref:5-dehydro-4-deoxy-D-glucuronate isomerase n=1 Tax=Sphingomonas aracearum TaxID=2283317 RepID=A0A369W096_9SPHN|nr:5-dehydro-4-deoxy-D-glucuronate isomerase [Sphingomonas aracearum]RDE07337.1 5-dehydro-4-deoxy-D-glucuronate isomerase [Sphingomonas aracearum]